ncbi:hypothetical protein LCM02_04895 [Lutimonas saemankumensis]|uniref:hypothetical protein n=1 Tax=Lutimonas saemankumensis TaxID=483016 RepID=UPI001CD4F52A|nr:hypothetical protein [Lutimonas saemankumensis]MCA0931779.1 hypothetical protein [Lutimonas saemankumensis]
MKKNYFPLTILLAFFLPLTLSAQMYKLDDGMVGRVPVTFKEGSYIKIKDSVLELKINAHIYKSAVREFKIIEDQTKKFDDREIRTLRLLSKTDENLRVHGTIVTGENVRNTVSANYYDMTTQITIPYVIFLEN